MSERVHRSVMNIKVGMIFYVLSLLLAFFSRKVFLDCLGTEFIGLTGMLMNIMSFLSVAELGIGRFTYYLAKFGGFNYISKEVVADPDEPDSFYNLKPKPLYENKDRSEYTNQKKDKEAIKSLDKQQAHRNLFLHDVEEAIYGENQWVIIFADHLNTAVNTTDFHFTCALKDGSQRTISDDVTYNRLLEDFSEVMKADFDLTCDRQSARFPLMKNNLCYTIRGVNPQPHFKSNPKCNAFVLRPSSKLMNFDTRNMAIAFRLAQLFSEHLDGGRGILKDDVLDLKKTGFGY